MTFTSLMGVMLMLGGQAAPAQPQGDDIVVIAKKPVEAKTARKFVRDISVATDGQLAKFRAPVCPVAIGFAPEATRGIEARIRRVTLAVGGAVAKPGCTGNLLLFASDDGVALIREIRSRYPRLVNGLQPYQLDRLVARPGPVWSWNITALENEDGARPSGGPGVNANEFRVMEVKSASNLNPPYRQVIDSAAVVIDAAALIGKSDTQIADYVAMRTLARTKPATAASLDTILGLFADGTEAPPSLTDADLAYMKGLYRVAGNRATTHQIGQIARRVEKDGGGRQ